MSTSLFHKEIFLPAGIVELFDGVSFSLDVTRHAEQAALSDRYGKLEIPAMVRVLGSDIVEAEVKDGEVVKVVIRQQYDEKRDVIFVLIPNYERATLKTVWFNLRSDAHKTLKRHLYANA